jgi:hypothetical protein
VQGDHIIDIQHFPARPQDDVHLELT